MSSLRRLLALLAGCLAVTLAPATASARVDPYAGGLAFGARYASAVWVEEGPDSLRAVFADGYDQTGPPPTGGGWMEMLRVYCEEDFLIVSDVWNTEPLPFTADPLLETASVRGASASGEGVRVSWPDCDGTTDDGREVTELKDVPVSIDAQLTAVSNPKTYSLLAHEEDPLAGCAEALAVAGVYRDAVGTVAVPGYATLDRKSLWRAEMSAYGAAVAGFGATDDCASTDRASRLGRWERILRARGSKWAGVVRAAANSTR